MILKKIRLNNFMSFYGNHALQLGKGLNFIVGPGGSGKTNLARAFKFAVLGHINSSRIYRINRKHREDSKNPGCLVEVEVEDQGKKYLAHSSLSVVGQKLKQSSKIDLRIDETITSVDFKRLYIDVESYAPQRSADVIIKHLRSNSEGGPRMVILDGGITNLVGEPRELLDRIEGISMEQVIIMEKYLPKDLVVHQLKIHNIKFNWEKYSSEFA